MQLFIRTSIVLALGITCWMPSPVLAQAAGGRTVWHALGIPQVWSRTRDATLNRFGNFPGLEKKPPLKKLADPSNLESDNPLLKTAAEIKVQEDLAPQKKKALKYLAKMGCGCYPGVAEAFLEGLRDCTEEVRLTAAESLQEAAGDGCARCNQDSCCSKEILEELARIAFERDDQGCWLEPSEAVRDAARAALEACCPHTIPLEILGEEEEPKEAPKPKGDPGANASLSDRYPGPERVATSTTSDLGSFIDVGSAFGDDPPPVPVTRSQLVSLAETAPAPVRPPAARPHDGVRRSMEGEVLDIARSTGVVTIGCRGEFVPVVGSEAKVYHQYLLGVKEIATLRLISSQPGEARAQVLTRTGRMALGDTVRLQVEDGPNR
jgi:hypothetical protein